MVVLEVDVADPDELGVREGVASRGTGHDDFEAVDGLQDRLQGLVVTVAGSTDDGGGIPIGGLLHGEVS